MSRIYETFSPQFTCDRGSVILYQQYIVCFLFYEWCHVFTQYSKWAIIKGNATFRRICLQVANKRRLIDWLHWRRRCWIQLQACCLSPMLVNQKLFGSENYMRLRTSPISCKIHAVKVASPLAGNNLMTTKVIQGQRTCRYSIWYNILLILVGL